jgi:hypothetical protein
MPVLVNVGETHRPIHLEGTGLGRVEAVSSDAGAITGTVVGESWIGDIRLKTAAAVDTRFPLVLKVKGLESPVIVQEALKVVGPRPRVISARRSTPGELSLAMRLDELPAGATVGLVLDVANVHDRPKVDLTCDGGALRKPLSLVPDEQNPNASLSFAGPDVLYLSLDPATVGYPGCRLTATVQVEPEGRSDAYALGRIVRVPRLEQFSLSTERLGPATYAGLLKGTDLEMVEKVGWDSTNGLPVESIPTPVPGEPARQVLRVALPWPAPSPHAPLYIWLRGEAEGRKTAVAY